MAMLFNAVRFFGPGVVDLLRVMWSPDEGGGGASTGGSNEEGVSGEEPIADRVAVDGELAAMRDRLVALYRERSDVVPELIGGETLAEIEASLVTSQQAFSRVTSGLQDSLPANGTNQTAIAQESRANTARRNDGTARVFSTLPPVAAGGGERKPGMASGTTGTMTAVQKIAAGLAARSQSR
ncbi:MAG: hypothetical protein HXX20_14820 [Chloroflexi bacterium]|nr:hypothetical protein [Chloroflexota bacterium]